MERVELAGKDRQALTRLELGPASTRGEDEHSRCARDLSPRDADADGGRSRSREPLMQACGTSSILFNRLDNGTDDGNAADLRASSDARGADLRTRCGPGGWLLSLGVPAFFVMGGVIVAIAVLAHRRATGAAPRDTQGNIEAGDMVHHHVAEPVRRTAGSEPEPGVLPLRRAWVMMAYSPDNDPASDHLFGALALARQLQRVSKYPVVLLTNNTHLPDGTRMTEVASKLNVLLRPVYHVEMKMGKLPVASWRLAFWKLQVWTMTEFDTLVWLDVDSMVTRSLDWVFDLDWMWAQSDDWFCNLDWQNHGAKVCSGLVLLYPNLVHFAGLVAYAFNIDDEMANGDQQLIRRYFADVVGKPIQLLSGTEAQFGRCIPGTKTALVSSDGDKPYPWNMPAFVHKSGGRGDHGNMCFTVRLKIQQQVNGTTVLNPCHFNPVAAIWRQAFCEAMLAVGADFDLARSYCSDAVYYEAALG